VRFALPWSTSACGLPKIEVRLSCPATRSRALALATFSPMRIGNPCLLGNIVMWWSLLTILGVLLVLATCTDA
jgi:hypothetical protein